VYRWISGVAVAVLALGVFGVGCGGGSDSGSSDSEPVAHVSKAQFLKTAAAVCVSFSKERLAAGEASYNKKVRAAGGKVNNQDLKVLAEEVLAEAIIPSLRKQQEELEAVGAPAADEEKIEKMLQSMEQGTDSIEEEGFEKLNYNQFDPFEEEAKAYGLKCKVI
jgi:hypothetical protein